MPVGTSYPDTISSKSRKGDCPSPAPSELYSCYSYLGRADYLEDGKFRSQISVTSVTVYPDSSDQRLARPCSPAPLSTCSAVRQDAILFSGVGMASSHHPALDLDYAEQRKESERTDR